MDDTDNDTLPETYWAELPAFSERDEIEDDELKLKYRQQQLDHQQKQDEAEIDRLRERIEDLKTDRKLKKWVADFVFRFLMWETVAVFAIVLLQGLSSLPFSVSETTLNIFLPATIIQISTMAIIITRYLFPQR